MRRIICLISLSISLSSCVTPPDIPACRSLPARVIEKKDPFGIPVKETIPNPVCMKQIGEPSCGYCTWSISEKHAYVGDQEKHHLYKKPWTQILAESVKMPTEAYAEIKSYIIKICKQNQDCNADIAKWRVKLDSLDSIVGDSPGR